MTERGLPPASVTSPGETWSPVGGEGDTKPARPSPRGVLAAYYRIKYRVFARERRPADGRRGLVVLQLDALAHRDLRRAIALGYCPTLARLLDAEGYELRRWFCGLPSATPYCQAGIFHGENGGIPAFRFYDKGARRVITCNAPHGVQYIRDRIRSPGALAGGSSYVNLLDGDARTVAFTVATRERMSVYRRLGGTRMALLIALHPIRVGRMVFQAAIEWLREEQERLVGELARRRTHSEGIFPLIRILSNVVVRELQTMAILLDVYLGVPVIYSTFMQYDELAHHFGPSSWQALRDLRRTDARIAEIARMTRAAAGREYDLVILSDHGMTPAASYRVEFGESLGTTVEHLLASGPHVGGAAPLRARVSYADDTEYADVGPAIVEAAAQVLPAAQKTLRRLRDWVRRHYGLREIILPEKFYVAPREQVVVTYSSCLALVYFADVPRPLTAADIEDDARRRHLHRALVAHPGVGLVATRAGDGAGARVESRLGVATVTGGVVTVWQGDNPLAPYADDPAALRALESLVGQPNAGDLVVFGAYDGYEIVSFDDQVGAHGSLGGDQVWPFLLAPTRLGLGGERIEDARDIHRVLMRRYTGGGAAGP
ncbi:MAG TPA: alkaline phosphatase family protein [Gemmatimonadaceae bacterium]|nr:alkaline phosphatase family protein [Gemmatimonadaceae bacterium]